MLRENIVSELNDSSYLTLLADGTTDRNGIEMISIAFRYIRNGVPVETLVAIEATNDISAMGLKNTIINTIETLGINGEKIISQCYDGANVMSGSRGGVQKLVEEYYNRIIPYIHCFNHKLHLVVEAVVLHIDACRLFFGEVRLLHNFFSRFKVRREYSGTNIPRLIETRWSGHLYAVQSINKNYEEILSTLKKIKEGNGNNFLPEDVASSFGITNSIMRRKFVFMLHFFNGLLSTLEPANQILQKREIGFRQAMPVIEAVFTSLECFRCNEQFDRFGKSTDETLATIGYADVPRTRRVRQRSSRLNDSVVMETLGEDHFENENDRLKSTYFEVIDKVLVEMKRRFHNNSDILIAISELNNLNSNTFSRDALEPLKDIRLILPSEAELNVVTKFLAKEMEKPENANNNALKILLPVKDAFSDTYLLFEAAEVFGSSTAINECSFSALARIDTVRRMSMTDQRLRDLSFLAFEKNRLTLNDIDIMRKFSEKNRRIQLF